jgi:PAS domain S-box-containing protein
MAFELFRAQQAVRQSEREWSDLYENAPIAYFTVTEEGVIRRCNRQAERLLGSDRLQIVGTRALELCAHTEGTREHAPGLFERAGCGETVEDEELILHAPGGADIPVSVSMNPIRAPEAEAADYRMMITDISNRKQAEDGLRRNEQIYRAIVENVADVVAWYDGELNLRYVSPQAKHLFGYELADFAELSVFDIVHPDDRELVFTRAIAAGAGQITLTYRARQHNGKYRLVENRATHLYDASGKLTDVISIVRPAAGENLGSNRHAAPQASP